MKHSGDEVIMEINEGKFRDLYHQVRELNLNLQRARRPRFFKDLSRQEISVIRVIGEKGSISMKKLSELTAIKPNTLSGVVLKLQNKKFVDRYEGDDRRLVIVDFDPAWQSIYQTYVREQEKIAKMIVNNVGEEKLDELVRLVAEVTRQLNEIKPAIKRTV